MALLSSPWQVGTDILSCVLLGSLVGFVRCFAPKRGRAAFCADALSVGFLLLLLQSYAAGKSYAGEVRWYMAGGAILGSCAVCFLLRDIGWKALKYGFSLFFLPFRWLKNAVSPRRRGRRAGHIGSKKNEKSGKKS